MKRQKNSNEFSGEILGFEVISKALIGKQTRGTALAKLKLEDL